jgi:hypothetical protein
MSYDTTLAVDFAEESADSSLKKELEQFASPVYESRVFEPDSTLETYVQTKESPPFSPVLSKTDEILPQKINRYMPKGAKLKPESRFIALRKWEGVVVEVENDVCLARIRDLMREDEAEEEITFPIDELSKSDRPLVAKGSLFIWLIGYSDKANGQRIRESCFIFRRLPSWKQDEIDKIKRESRPLADLLNDEEKTLLRP